MSSNYPEELNHLSIPAYNSLSIDLSSLATPKPSSPVRQLPPTTASISSTQSPLKIYHDLPIIRWITINGSPASHTTFTPKIYKVESSEETEALQHSCSKRESRRYSPEQIGLANYEVGRMGIPDIFRPLSAGSDSGIGAGAKEKRISSVTPRKFRKFFTPRPHSSIRPARETLHIISGNEIQSSPIRAPAIASGQENRATPFTRNLKRRKVYHTPDASPQHSYDTKYQDNEDRMVSPDADEESDIDIPSSPCERVHDRGVISDDTIENPVSVKPIRRLQSRGISDQLRDMQIRAAPSRQHFVYPDYRNETAAFYSRPADVHYSSTSPFIL
jgi:hypothetical protein